MQDAQVTKSLTCKRLSTYNFDIMKLKIPLIPKEIAKLFSLSIFIEFSPAHGVETLV